LSGNLAKYFLLREGVNFLNHGSFGACPRPVFDVYQSFQRELEAEPVDFLARRLGELMRVPRVALSAELGTSSENIVGLVNATVALNIVVQSLDLKPGDEILTTDHEYSAMDKAWAYVARRSGAKIVTVSVPLPLVSEADFTAAVVAGMTERTRVLFLSHITSPTALYFPIAPALAEARRRGILSVIDGAHTPGHVSLDLDTLGADYYAGNCHKWLMTAKGSAFLYARPEVQTLLNPLIVSHGWTANSKEPGAKGAFGNSPFIDELEVIGTRDPSAMLTIPAALAFRQLHNWSKVMADCADLAQETARRVEGLTGLAPFSSPEFCAPQMVAMRLPPCDPDELHNSLMQKFHIDIPVFKWKDGVIVRLSVQGYNTASQMDVLVDALTTLLRLEPGKSPHIGV
jgi:isopenicillin-N epimerase